MSPRRYKPKARERDDDYDFKDVSIEVNSNIPPLDPTKYRTPEDTSAQSSKDYRTYLEAKAKKDAAGKRQSQISTGTSTSSSTNPSVPSGEPECEPHHYLRDSVMGVTRPADTQPSSPYDFEPFSNPRPAPLPPSRKSGSSHGSQAGSRSSLDTRRTVPLVEPFERGHRATNSTTSLPSSQASLIHPPPRSAGKLRKANPLESLMGHGDKEDAGLKAWRYEDFEQPDDDVGEIEGKEKRSSGRLKGIFGHKRKSSAPAAYVWPPL